MHAVFSRCHFSGALRLVLALLWVLSPPQAQADMPAIAAAADLKFALGEIATQFRQATGQTVNLTFGSSGNFYRQIEQGAPFQIFLSADEIYVQRLAAAGKTVDGGQLYAIGRVVLFAPHGSPLEANAGMAGLEAALARGQLHHFAIANPEHAPYGRAAEQILRNQGLWERIRPRLVLGENAAQAAHFAMTGSAQGGILPYALALSPELNRAGRFILLPETWHQPLRQRMVLIRGAGATAQAFYRYLQGHEARETLRRYGFTLPMEQ